MSVNIPLIFGLLLLEELLLGGLLWQLVMGALLTHGLHRTPLSATTDSMPAANTKLTAAVETYLTDLQRIRASGGATAERSRYTPLANLLNAVGHSLKPKVFCVTELADQGAGHPDFGLYAAKQLQKGQPKEGQIPESGVVEVKPSNDDA